MTDCMLDTAKAIQAECPIAVDKAVRKYNGEDIADSEIVIPIERIVEILRSHAPPVPEQRWQVAVKEADGWHWYDYDDVIRQFSPDEIDEGCLEQIFGEFFGSRVRVVPGPSLHSARHGAAAGAGRT